MRSFAKIKLSRNSKNSLSITDVGKSWQSRDCLPGQICLLMLFAKTKFLQKFPNLQYIDLPVPKKKKFTKYFLIIEYKKKYYTLT